MSSIGIMIVEDERLVAGHIDEMVTRLGYRTVGITGSGEDAVRLTRKLAPDLVLMDIRLSGKMDGIEAAGIIRKETGLPFIYLSAYADKATVERAKVTEPAGYIIKPFEEKDLHTAIETAIFKHESETRLRKRERWLSTILTSIGDAVISTDLENRVTFMNSMAEQLTEREKTACLGLPVSEVLRIAEEKDGMKIPILLGKPARNKPLPSGKMDILLLRQEEDLPIELLATPIREGNSEIDGSVIVFRDIKERKEQERKLAFLAIHDSLTGLPNRILFNDHLTLALAGAARRGLNIAVLMLDLDRFKDVNDTLGHAAGDLLLISVAGRLGKCLRRGDTVARLGGDEFLVLLPEIVRESSILKITERLLRSFSVPFHLGEREVAITASIGVAIYPQGGEDVDTLLRNADIAMYAAKEGGRNGYRIHDEEGLPETVSES